MKHIPFWLQNTGCVSLRNSIHDKLVKGTPPSFVVMNRNWLLSQCPLSSLKCSVVSLRPLVSPPVFPKANQKRWRDGPSTSRPSPSRPRARRRAPRAERPLEGGSERRRGVGSETNSGEIPHAIHHMGCSHRFQVARTTLTALCFHVPGTPPTLRAASFGQWSCEDEGLRTPSHQDVGFDPRASGGPNGMVELYTSTSPTP